MFVVSEYNKHECTQFLSKKYTHIRIYFNFRDKFCRRLLYNIALSERVVRESAYKIVVQKKKKRNNELLRGTVPNSRLHSWIHSVSGVEKKKIESKPRASRPFFFFFSFIWPSVVIEYTISYAIKTIGEK